MRSSFVATLLFFVALPLASVFAQHHHHHHQAAGSTSCGCGAPIPAAPSCSTCNTCSAPTPCATCNAAPSPCATCDTCNTCNVGGACGGGCGSCGGGLCSNPALFYETLYAEFYARNPWYLEHKQRAGAARLARMYGKDPDAATPPPKSPGPIKAPAPKPAANKVAEPVKAPEPKAEADKK